MGAGRGAGRVMSPVLLRPVPLWALRAGIAFGASVVFALVWCCIEMVWLVVP